MRAATSAPAAALHPALARWFEQQFGSYSEIQKSTLPHTLAGRSTLILAPTGSGKTLAAFLSVLSNLARDAEAGELPDVVRAVYVSPLKALDTDIHRNLEAPLAAINATLDPARRIRMEVRTGDTSLTARSRQQRRKPHLLLTTSESLSALLSQKGWRDDFDLRTVVVDEIHAFAENKRGSLLALSLERIEAHGERSLQRIGLSATAWPVEAVVRLLCGRRDCAVAVSNARRSHHLDLAVPSETALPPAGHSPYRIAHLAAEMVRTSQCTLAFTITRSSAERLGLALKVLLPEWDDRIAVHHSSVDRQTRLETEALLKLGEMKAVVCSTSLELGVDFNAVDLVLLVGAPHGVSSALQRLGRSGHQVNGVARGVLVPCSLPDLLECVALRRAANAGHLDRLSIPNAPLDVLAQALLGMSVERPWRLDEAFEVVTHAGPYLELRREDFDAVIQYLAGGGRVLGPYGTYGKIALKGDTFEVASRRVARNYYLNVGTISDEYQVKILTKGNRKLGEVSEGFLASLNPGDAFVIGGRAVRVKQMHRNTAIVEPAKGERLQTPRWIGNKMPLTLGLAQEELALRRDMRRAWGLAGKTECRRVLEKAWKLPSPLAAVVANFVERQNRAAPVPVDDPVQVEFVRDERSSVIVFHVLAGRAANHALAWVLAYRLRDRGSVVSNFDDRTFFVSLDHRREPSLEELRAAFQSERWRADLQGALESTEALGRSFRPIAEVGQLLPRRTLEGETSARTATWSASLLYTTLMKYEPDHPLVREAVREYLEDRLDAARAEEEAARLHAAAWEVFRHPRPSPFALALYAAFNAEVLLAQDPDRALDDVVARIYDDWRSQQNEG